MLAKIVVGVISSLFLFIFLGTVLWFGGRGIWTHVMDGEAAPRAQPSLLATVDQDKADASASAKTCDARVQGAYRAAAAPRPRVNGVQPTLGADDIRGLIHRLP